ncbi:MAG: DUF1573 domain-containing protein [Bacteroidales bacterium]|nr:DUF1573 domain-containing protein [Bacteroidales bacterium]
MKKIIILFVFLVTGLRAQKGAEITFQKLVHDFGQIQEGTEAVAEFVFTNTGDAPLLISNVKSSCGCTVPFYPKEPILPGKTGLIKARYDTNRIGKFNKQITVLSNATNGEVSLRITGEVIQKPSLIIPSQNFDNNNVPIAP